MTDFSKFSFDSSKKRNSGSSKSLFAIFIVILLVAGSIYTYLQYKKYQDFSKADTSKTGILEFEVKKGESLETIAESLVNAKLLPNTKVFTIPTYKIYLKFHDISLTNIQVGKHALAFGQAPDAIFASLKPKPCTEIKATLLEGQRVEEFSEILENKFSTAASKFSRNEYIQIARSYSNVNSIELGFNPPKNLEGYLFPDTYQFCEDVTAQEIIDTQLQNFDKKVYQKYQSSFNTNSLKLEGVIKLASIVEREARQVESKKMVAGVFLNRLQANMPLGSDVTSMYGYGFSKKQQTWWVKEPELVKAVTNTNDPYNTRAKTGLTPTPISNPGINSIAAVLEPTKNSYLYFIVGIDNKLYYGKTLAEHNRNVCKYLTLTCR